MYVVFLIVNANLLISTYVTFGVMLRHLIAYASVDEVYNKVKCVFTTVHSLYLFSFAACQSMASLLWEKSSVSLTSQFSA